MNFAMLFDVRHSAEGLVCLNSILEHGTAKVHVLCLEERVAQLLPTNRNKVVMTYLSELEQKYPVLGPTKSKRPWAAYTQSLKPFFLSHVMDMDGSTMLAYVDSDFMFWSAYKQAIEQELGKDSVLLVPYNKDSETPPSYFNGGFVACRQHSSRRFLDWWQEQCIKWCSWEGTPEGLFADEGHLTTLRDKPNKFQGIKVCTHPGIDLAPWNVGKHTVEKVNGVVMVDQTYPLVCFHYQGFVKASETFVVPENVSAEIADLLYRPYFDLMPVDDPKLPEDDPRFVPALREELLQFQEEQGDVVLEATTYSQVPENLKMGACNDSMVSFVMTTIEPGAPAVLIKYKNRGAVGFFVPRGMNGKFEMPIYIDPFFRNKKIGQTAIQMYMTGKQGSVFILAHNEIGKKTYAAAGFVKAPCRLANVNGRLFETWTRNKD